MFFPAVIVREHDRTADRGAVLILGIRWLGGVECVLRIQDVVPHKFPPISMELVRARFYDYVYVRTRSHFQLTVNDLGLNLELLNRVWGRADRPRIEEKAVIRDPIQRVIVLGTPLAVYRRANPASTF